ncbi:MAG: hypothetical protein ABSB22_19035, partial [Thermodesulfobacteriota bacterium]
MIENSAGNAQLSIVPDVTEHKKAQEEIAAWKNRYELVTAASGQLVYEYDVTTGDRMWGPR